MFFLICVMDYATSKTHVFSDLRDGLRYLKDNHRVRSALVQLIILFSIFAALTVLAVRMAEIIPHLKASQFGFLLAAGGVGIAAGATILGLFGQRFSYTGLSLCGCLGMAASLIGLSIFTTQLWIVLLLVAWAFPCKLQFKQKPHQKCGVKSLVCKTM